MIRAIATMLILALAVCAPAPSHAQGAPTQAAAPAQPLTLAAAIQYAAEHSPSVRVALAQMAAATANVTVAHDASWPRLDSLLQANRATANNIFGQVLPQPVMPALTGPVLASASADSIWSSAVGMLFTWEPVDFGPRQAGIAGAEAALSRAGANEALARLELENAVASSFLTVLAAQRLVAAAQADVDRRSVLRQSIQTLVDNQLRPGADASRADAERAAAQTRLIQAQQSLAIARITLGRLLGLSIGVGSIDGDALLAQLPPPASGAASRPARIRPCGCAMPLSRRRVTPRMPWRRRIDRVCSCKAASSRAAAAPTQPVRSTPGSGDSRSIARIGQPARS